VKARRCEAGTLELGAGLEVLVSASLATLQDGDLLDVVVDSRSSSLELPAWARRAGTSWSTNAAMARRTSSRSARAR
jgi:hypothetical protein